MLLNVLLILPFLATLLLPGVAVLIWRKKLQRPWLYTGLSLLVMQGVRDLVVAVLNSRHLFYTGGYYVQYGEQPSAKEDVRNTLINQNLTELALVVVVGFFVLRILSRAMAQR